MKRIYLILCSLAVLCTACRDENIDITYISETTISAQSSTAEVCIYVKEQNGYNSSATIEEYGVYLSTNPNPTEKNEKRSKKQTGSNYNNYYLLTIDGLSANTTYYALPFISNRYGKVTGKVVPFTTNGTAKVTTKAASEVTTTTAQLNATVEIVGTNVNLEKRGFVLSTSNNPTTSTSGVTNWSETGKTGNYGLSLTGLKSSTQYYFRGYVVVDGETLYGNVLNFTTLTPDEAITFSPNDATEITENSAYISGSITIGQDAVGSFTECGFMVALESNPTYNSSGRIAVRWNSNSNVETWSGTKNLHFTLTDLTANTTYYYRMYYRKEGQDYYDNTVKSFRTTGSSQSYYTVSQIMSVYNSLGLASGATSADTYTVRAYVTQWKSGYPDYQNADFWIDDSANGSTTMLMCFRLTGVYESDRRTLVVGDYIEAQNCHLMNYNGKAELKDGTFTVIKEASQGSTLGSQVSDFVGTWSCYEYNMNNSSYKTQEGVKIYTWTNSETNSEWIAVSGLAGYSDQKALGEFDASLKVLRLYSDIAFTSDTWTSDGVTYIDRFYPVYVTSNGSTWSGEVLRDGGNYGFGEAWLYFNNSGQLVLGGAQSADSNGNYANGYAFAQYKADDDNHNGWYDTYTNVVLTKTSSSVSAPKRNMKLTRWHAPMRLPLTEKAVRPNRHRY